MSTFETVLLMLLVVDALALGGLVLIQQGRGADVGAAFGSGSSNTMFGSGGSASFLTKITVWLAIGFFLISFGLAYTAKERAAEVDDFGIPGITGLEVEEDLPEEQLTPQDEGVDSDVPEI
jgi:preprotein translocase subunit SecG